MTVQIDGLEIEVASWKAGGDTSKPSILLLHEGLGSVSAWGDFPQALADVTGCNTIAYSRAGYGRSTVDREPFGVDYMHREAETVLPHLLDRLGLKSAFLFGHSDGGSIALIFAARFPERVSALVLEAPHVFVEPLTVESIAKIAAAYPNDTRLQRGLGRHHSAPDVAFMRWSSIWLDVAFREWDITALLPRVRAPLLVFQGKDDEYGTRSQLEAIASAVPFAQTALLERCAHAPHRDARDAVLDRTSDFLARVVTVRGPLVPAEKKERP